MRASDHTTVLVMLIKKAPQSQYKSVQYNKAALMPVRSVWQPKVHFDAWNVIKKCWASKPFCLRSLKSCEVRVKCSQSLMFAVKVSANRTRWDWPTSFTAFSKNPYLAFLKERQGVSNVDTPEVCGRICVCVCVHVWVCLYMSVYVKDVVGATPC